MRVGSKRKESPSSSGVTSSYQRQSSVKAQQQQPMSSLKWLDDIEDDDDDDELSKFANSSPFFTQPTQPLNKATQPTQPLNKGTQPTQIINKGTQPTQIINRPTTTTTAMPSSPVAPSSPTSTIEVPASSPFQPKSHSKPEPESQPAAKTAGRVASLMAPAGTAFKAPTAPARPAVKAKYVGTSDDDLVEDYKRDSSDEEDHSPMRGHIQPSSFTKQPPASTAASLNKSKPNWPPQMDMALTDIKDIRLRHATKSVHDIVKRRKPQITIRACRSAVMKSVSWQVSTAVELLLGEDKKDSKPANKSISSSPTKRRSASPEDSASPPKPSFQSTLAKFAYGKSESQNSTKSQASDTDSKPANPPRRRLMQGRRRQRSPSPTPIFSVSSSATSPPTSPAESTPRATQQSDKMEVDSPIRAAAQPRRRLVKGSRPQKPAAVITLDSDSDEEFPQPKKLASRKRKADTEEPIRLDSDDEGATGANANALSSDQDEDDMSTAKQDKVLDYLNTCSAEELGRMTGLPADSKIIVAERPFKSLNAARRVSKKDKAKSKSKASRTEIGSYVVDKLTDWFEAFEAAGEVISECEGRGAVLQSIMSTWNMDKNGRTITDAPHLNDMPITEQPEGLDKDVVTLKSYQLLGLNWLNMLHGHGFSGILADDMGLGKTCQVISFVTHLVESWDPESGKDRPWPNLIVVPPSTCENWMNEFSRFAPDISVQLYTGTHRREIDPVEAQDYHVVLTTYTQVEKRKEDLEWLKELDPYSAIYDEGHKLKNPNTLVYKQMMRVPTQWRLVLSGTPVQNNLKELLGLLNFVEPSLFKSGHFDRLQTIFETKVVSKDVHNFAALAKERVGNARTIMAPFILQRRKDEVLDLAKKTEDVELVGMHPDQKEIYEEIKGRYLLPKGSRKKSTIKESNPWMQLRKAANHPQLFRRHFTDKRLEKMVDLLWKNCSEDELCVQSKADRHKELFRSELGNYSDFQLHVWCKDFPRYVGHLDIPHRSWEEAPKVQKLLELLRGYQKTGDRALVFSRFELVIDILRETFHHAGIPYCELTGATSTSDRFPEIQKFNENPDIPVFILTTGAGGTGINLTAANKIILFDQSDNPQEDVQASNRAHRIGQTRDVQVIRLITENTVEGLVYNSCVKKLMLAACVEGQFDNGEDEDSIEEECKKLMLLENEGVDISASQQA